MLIITVKVRGSNLQNNKFFLHQIKLNWHGWSPQRVHEHSMSSLSSTAHGVPMECSWSAHGLHGLHVECSWTAHGLHVECRKYSHGVLMDCSYCSWSAHGVHGKVWGSVKYSCRFGNVGSIPRRMPPSTGSFNTGATFPKAFLQ